MKLKEESIRWAINHLIKEKDTDLFPSPKEIYVFDKHKEAVIKRLKDLDISQHKFSPSRRFVIPKEELSYRVATQLDPIDSLLLAAITYEFGSKIEHRRRRVSEDTVFSYRFNPLENGIFYSNESSWNDFWKACLQKSEIKKYVVQMDISDFYNQIYHHTMENQLTESGLPNQVTKFIIRLLEHLTMTVSRGIPIGPHSSHLLAESTLIPIDDSLSVRGVDFCRYADDIFVFCNTEKEAKIAIYNMAGILDKQQRLILQKQKTKILTTEDFIPYCEQMLNDNPMNENEDKMIKVLKKYTAGLYQAFNYRRLNDDEIDCFSAENIEELIEEYLEIDDPDFKKIRWFYRRLSQLGIPTGIEFTIKNINRLMPAISDICHYLISASEYFEDDFLVLGDNLMKILEDPLINANEYFYIAIVNLFASNSNLNHLTKLLELFQNSAPEIKRKIIFAAYEAKASSWIRELKESYSGLDPWSRRALLIACSILPEDEKEHYLKHIKKTHTLSVTEEILIEWALKKG
ncbi:RNA-directed DNA polymerase [Paenibacillus enshidis]|uniref:RNA-directed DNA polymerase n=1 Tax=Paenibacillus enshidis TaxID=1458439 RepID=A0ABV5B3P2_9BACL